MDYIYLPQSTSALDRWSDRAIRVVYWEVILALVSVIFASSYFPKPGSKFEYDPPPMTKTKLAVAVPTIFLPLASCVTSCQISCRRVRLAPGLAAHDFVRFSARSHWFWFSLVQGVIPALAGTIYGLVGIARFFFAGSAQLALYRYRSPAAGKDYSDDTIEHCALERAYQQQLPDDATDPDLAVTGPADGYRANGGDMLLSQLRPEATTYDRSRNIHDVAHKAIEQEPCASQTPARNDQSRSWDSISPPTQPRFRWQEQIGARNGGATFWGPIVATSSLISIWGGYYRWLVRNSYRSPELIRLILLEAIAPAFITALSNIFLIFCLRRPFLALIFTAFCFTVLASAIWLAEFVYSVWCFFYYMRQISIGFNFTSFAMVLVSFGMTWCHVSLLHCSVKMEWTSGYSSLAREYELWKERRGEAGADIGEAEDEGTGGSLLSRSGGPA